MHLVGWLKCVSIVCFSQSCPVDVSCYYECPPSPSQSSKTWDRRHPISSVKRREQGRCRSEWKEVQKGWCWRAGKSCDVRLWQRVEELASQAKWGQNRKVQLWGVVFMSLSGNWCSCNWLFASPNVFYLRVSMRVIYLSASQHFIRRLEFQGQLVLGLVSLDEEKHWRRMMSLQY